MYGPARRRFAIVVTCLGMAGCAAQKLPIEPFASDTANSAPPSVVKDELQLSVDHGPAPGSPYAKGQYANGPSNAANEAPPSRAATPAQFTSTPVASSGPSRSAAPAPKPDDAEALARVVAELQAVGPIAPADQARLVADLQQTDPALWPTLLQTFKAGVAYRNREPRDAAPTKVADKVGAKEPLDEPTAQPTSLPADKTLPLIPPSVLAQLRAAESGDPLSNLPLDALGGGGGMNSRGAKTPGIGLPTQTILQAALAEAQRKDEEQSRKPASKVSVAMHVEKVSDAEADAELAAKAEAKSGRKRDTNNKDEEKTTADWQESLRAAITGLESQTRESPRSAGEVSRHAWLRMLYLAAGRREDALKPIPGVAAAEQDFWSEQIYGLATYLDTEKLTDPARRSAEARSHLAKAEKRLSEASTLAVRSLAFCTEVSSYGVYQKFKEDRFKAGQPVILYCEVENFRSEESAKGFHTALRSSYQILDAQGRRVAENDLALTEEYCQNERRDYFIRYFVSVPERIYDGKYTLQLTIVDTLSQKIGQSTIDFTVGEEKK